MRTSSLAAAAVAAIAACGSSKKASGPSNAAAVFAIGKEPALPGTLRVGMSFDEARAALPQLELTNDGRGDPWEARAGDDRILVDEQGGVVVRVGAAIPANELPAFVKAWGPARTDKNTQFWLSPEHHIRADVSDDRKHPAHLELWLEPYVTIDELLARTDGRLSIESDGPFLGMSAKKLQGPGDYGIRGSVPSIRLTTDLGHTIVIDFVTGADGKIAALNMHLPYGDQRARDAVFQRLVGVYGAARPLPGGGFELGTAPVATVTDEDHDFRVIVGDASAVR